MFELRRFLPIRIFHKQFGYGFWFGKKFWFWVDRYGLVVMPKYWARDNATFADGSAIGGEAITSFEVDDYSRW